jgi:putative membrane protein
MQANNGWPQFFAKPPANQQSEKMKNIKTILAIATVLIISCKKNDDNPVPSVTGKDLQFMTKALPGNQAEIELGQLASQKAAAKGVAAFGNMMATEHSDALNDLKSINSNERLSLSTTSDAKHEQVKAQLSAVSGYMFDTLYIHGQVKDHMITQALYQSEIDSGKNTTVRNHAVKYLPHIKMHLAKADSLWKTLKP